MLELYVSLVTRLQDLREGERGQTMAAATAVTTAITMFRTL